MYESFNPEFEKSYKAVPMVCFACAEREKTAHTFHENSDEYNSAGVNFVIEKVITEQ